MNARPAAHAAGQPHDLAEWRPGRDLDDPGRRHGARDLDQDRARGVRVADRAEGLDAMAHDPGDARQRDHVVDEGRVADRARAPTGRAAAARAGRVSPRGPQEDRLLAQHVGALHGANGHGDVAAGAQDVGSQEAGLLGREDGGLEGPDRVRVLGPDREDGLPGAHRERGDGHAFDDRERAASP